MTITYLEAIREAQARALREDPRVYIYGQDVGDFGGAFKATKNLAQEFPGRVLDAPISEDAIVGSAVGAAVVGVYAAGIKPDNQRGRDFVLEDANAVPQYDPATEWRHFGKRPVSQTE